MTQNRQSEYALGPQLRSIRESKGLSLRAVERESGINSGYLSQLERGEISNPTPSVLQKVAKAYDQPMGRLMRWAGYVEDGLSPNSQQALSILGDDLSREEAQALKAVLDVLRGKQAPSFDALVHRTDLVLDGPDRKMVRGAAMGVLRELDALRTPAAVDLNAAMQVANLVSVGAIQLDDREKRSLRERFGDLADQALARLQGVVHLDRNEVFLNPDMHVSRRRFVHAHEIGHAVLEDHRIVFAHLDDTSRLSPAFNDLLERQANQFSIELLAKGDLLREEFDSSLPSMARLEGLASQYGISLQAAIRRLAEESHRPCAVAVAYKGQAGSGSLLLDTCKFWASATFEEEFGWHSGGAPEPELRDRLLKTSLGREVEPLSVQDSLGGSVSLRVEGKDSRFATFVLIACDRVPRVRARRLRRGAGQAS